MISFVWMIDGRVSPVDQEIILNPPSLARRSDWRYLDRVPYLFSPQSPDFDLRVYLG